MHVNGRDEKQNISVDKYKLCFTDFNGYVQLCYKIDNIKICQFLLPLLQYI